jgi:CBS domain-containing protein
MFLIRSSTSERRLKEKKIGEIINPRLIQATPAISVERAVEIMRENNSAYIVIADKKRVVGMFTESDLSQKILNKDVDWARPVSEFMSDDPVVLRPDDTVGRAVDLHGRIRFLPHPPRQRKTGTGQRAQRAHPRALFGGILPRRSL